MDRCQTTLRCSTVCCSSARVRFDYPRQSSSEAGSGTVRATSFAKVSRVNIKCEPSTCNRSNATALQETRPPQQRVKVGSACSVTITSKPQEQVTSVKQWTIFDDANRIKCKGHQATHREEEKNKLCKLNLAQEIIRLVGKLETFKKQARNKV